MNKDINIADALAKELGLRLPGVLNARKIYSRAVEQGLEGLDFSAVYKVVKQSSKVEEENEA